MPSLGIAPHPGGCAGRVLIPTQDAAPASGVFPMDADFHHLEIRDQAIQLFTISRGSRSTSSRTPEHDRCFPGMLLSPITFRIPGKPSDPRTSLRVPPDWAGNTTKRLVAHVHHQPGR